MDFFALLSNEQLRFKQLALNQRVRPLKAPPPQGKGKKNDQPTTPKPKGPKADWLPRAEYQKKLANGRKAAATAAAASTAAANAASSATANADRSHSRRHSYNRSRKRSRSPERKNAKNKKRR